MTQKEQANNEWHKPQAQTTEGKDINHSDSLNVLDMANNSLLISD